MIEKYPEDARTKDAKLYKGLSLIAISDSKEAIPILKDLITHYPGTDQAVRACTELKPWESIARSRRPLRAPPRAGKEGTSIIPARDRSPAA